MTFQVKASNALIAEMGSSNGQRDAAQYPLNGTHIMRGREQHNNIHLLTTFPPIHPLSKSRDGKSFLGSFISGGSPNVTENVSEERTCGRHFLFDKKYERLERTRTVIPPLPRDYRVHGSGNLHHVSLSKELSHSRAARPFPLGSSDRFELSTSPALLFPSALVLNRRNTLSVDQFNRPKVNYRTCNLFTVGDIQTNISGSVPTEEEHPTFTRYPGQSYPDPMVGASRSFIHRLSELSSLEGETMRQERLKKLSKPRKQHS